MPEPGEAAVEILPGHLVVVDPGALRLEFLYELFNRRDVAKLNGWVED